MSIDPKFIELTADVFRLFFFQNTKQVADPYPVQ